MTIAVLDWGIGGLPALMALRAALPRADFVYRSDAGFAPYGTVAAEALAARVDEVARDLHVRFAPTRLVLACNAASTIADRLALPFAVHDVIAPGIALAREAHAQGARRIGVVGGNRTIASRAHADALATEGIDVVAVATQPLSAHVEAGRLDGPELLADLVPVLDALDGRGDRIDALLLACTHYPALAPVIARLRPGLALLDPVARLVAEVVVATRDDGRGELRVETSGDPATTVASAWKAFGIDLTGRVSQRA